MKLFKSRRTVIGALRRNTWLTALLLALFLTEDSAPRAEGAVTGQGLEAGCVVSVLNRNALVSAAGGWLLPNVPAGFGMVRARASCIKDGITLFGESEPFEVAPNGSVNVPPIRLGAVTPIPTQLTLTSTLSTLTSPGATTQLTVNALYLGGAPRDVTGSATGTTYLSSNPAIASVSPEGLVQAVASGRALIQASHEGASGLISITVILSADSDEDGIPDDVELREGLDPNNPVDALEDADRDGLTNRDELQLGTQLRNADTDGDGITDGEEVSPGQDGFVTNPLLADTDGDGVRDGLELDSGSDPTDASSINLARALSRIVLTPPAFVLVVNTLINEASTQLRVVGHLRDGTTIDLTESRRGTAYGSSDLTVCNFGGVAGRIYAGREGFCVISASNSGFSASSTGRIQNFTPRRLSAISIPGYANNVEVSQDHAYVAAGSSGLQVVGISNKDSPVLAAARDTPGNANDVRIAGRYAYVADGPSGLQVIDIINPLAPVIAGTVDTPGDASDVAVSDGMAYVADGTRGLAILDVRSPSAPQLLGSLTTGGTARGVDIAGGLAIVADDFPAPALRFIDVTTPATPQLVSNLALPGASPKDVYVRGSLAYVAAYTGGVQIVDFSTPTAPRVVGSLPGSSPSGFVPRDVEVVDRFAIFAEQLFPNAVPLVDTSAPTTPVLRGLIDFSPLGDYAGTGVEVSGPYVYMTGEYYYVYQENGTTGNTRLFIGQYLPTEDNAGLPPQVTLTSPPAGATYYELDQLRVAADVTDDVAVGFVTFSVNGQQVFTDTSAPYEYTFTLPVGTRHVTLQVTAVDRGSNYTTAETSIQVLPDPLTTVSGIVVDETGTPVAGATVTTLGSRSTITSTSGAFAIPGVPTTQGPLIASVQYTNAAGVQLSGSSAPTPPVRNGVTNVGTVVLLPFRFETNYGAWLTNCDDCSFVETLPFSFSFYGVEYNTVYVGTNGYLTFTAPSWEYMESVAAFTSLPRIAPFFDDLYGRNTGAIYVNRQLPGRLVVTYDRVQQFGEGGSNTIQITLSSDGSILFAYRGITALRTGTITGLSPGPNQPVQATRFRENPITEVPASTAVYEYFTYSSPFNLDGAFVLFTPRPGGGYVARTILPANTSGTLQVVGAPSGVSSSSAPQAVSPDTAIEQNMFALAEAEITSSSDPGFLGMTNTDSRGVLSLSGVPPGGINVVLRKRGEIVGQAAAVTRPPLGNEPVLRVTLEPPSTETKPTESP